MSIYIYIYIFRDRSSEIAIPQYPAYKIECIYFNRARMVVSIKQEEYKHLAHSVFMFFILLNSGKGDAFPFMSPILLQHIHLT